MGNLLSLIIDRRLDNPPRRIAFHLHLSRSTVERVLHRYRMPVLAHTDQATGLPVRIQKPSRYEHSRCGDLVHFDTKKSVVSRAVADSR